ncbi:MAG: PilN domain-containing protein [Sedimentisphaerales bacterium]|nr:PilN domain-containing protein [Sedimentisphaerales bacterium]
MKKVDFLPEDYIEKKAQQRANIICLALFLVVLAGVGCGFAITEQRQGRIDARVRDVTEKMQKASEALKQLEVLEGKRMEMIQKATISASLMEPVPRSLLLATATNDLPAGVSLTEFKLVSKEIKAQPTYTKGKSARSRNKKAAPAAAAGPSDAKQAVEPLQWDTTIEITGLAPTDMQVAEFIANLDRSPLFRQVNLLYSEEHEVEEEMVRQFKLDLLLDPEARASEQDVERARKISVRGM